MGQKCRIIFQGWFLILWSKILIPMPNLVYFKQIRNPVAWIRNQLRPRAPFFKGTFFSQKKSGVP